MRTKYFSEARTSSRIQLSFGAASNQKLERNKKMPKTKNAENEKIDKFIWNKKSLKNPKLSILKVAQLRFNLSII